MLRKLGLRLQLFPTDGDFPGGYQFVGGEFSSGTPPPPIPEPGTHALMSTGLVGMAGLLRKKWLALRGGNHA
jgi:hypothetical protein